MLKEHSRISKKFRQKKRAAMFSKSHLISLLFTSKAWWWCTVNSFHVTSSLIYDDRELSSSRATSWMHAPKKVEKKTICYHCCCSTFLCELWSDLISLSITHLQMGSEKYDDEEWRNWKFEYNGWTWQRNTGEMNPPILRLKSHLSSENAAIQGILMMTLRSSAHWGAAHTHSISMTIEFNTKIVGTIFPSLQSFAPPRKKGEMITTNWSASCAANCNNFALTLPRFSERFYCEHGWDSLHINAVIVSKIIWMLQ